MKILHVSEAVVGGVVSHLAEILPYQISRYGAGNVMLMMPTRDCAEISRIDGLRILPFTARQGRLQTAWALAGLARQAVRDHAPDVVHAHSSFAGLATRLFRGAGKTPVVYCPHGWGFLQDVSRPMRLAYAAIERLQLPATSFIINVSHFEKAAAENFGLRDNHKLLVVENGISDIDDSLRPDVPALEADAIHIAFVGRASRAKGLDLLLEAAVLLEGKAVQFHLIGPTKRDVESLCAVLPENATIYGWKPRGFVKALVGQVDALVMPSRWEGLPMVGIEAMRAGRPIIATNGSVFPEMIDHGSTGILVDVGNPGAFAATLAHLDRAQLVAMGAAARRRYEQFYRADQQAEKIMAIYDRMGSSA